MSLRVGSVFTGVGGFDKAFERAGATVVWQVENDANCNKVLAHHWPKVPRYGDVKEVTRARLFSDLGDRAAIDVLVGGFPCFPAGTLVLTKHGLMPIEDIEVGDMVLTHRGRWCRVERVGSRQADTVVLSGYGHPGLVTTPEHPFLSTSYTRHWTRDGTGQQTERQFEEPTWTAAKDMRGRFWASPTLFPEAKVPDFDLIGRERPPVDFVGDEFFWVLGAWLGDGWAQADARRGRVTICEALGSEAVARYLDAAGLRYTTSAERTVVRRIISSRTLARWLDFHFGSGAATKTIPAWLLGLNYPLRQHFLRGYLAADGYVTEDGWKASSVSKHVAIGVKLLAQSVGHSVAMYRREPPETGVIEGRVVNQRPSWQLVGAFHPRSATVIDQRAWGLVRKVEDDKRRTVYNISVESDESFLADGIVVHNCTDLSVAGRRAGLAGERSGLFFQFMRLAVEFAPRWLLIENVPGLLSSCGCPKCRPSDEEAEDEWAVGGRTRPDHRGRDMATVLGTVGECGYGWAYRLLDAQYFGVAQRRRRVFIVGCAGGRIDRAAQVLFEPESCSGDPPPSREKGARTTRSVAGGAGAGGGAGEAGDGEFVAALRSSIRYGADDNQAQARHLIPVDLRNATLGDEVAGTLQAHHDSYSVNAMPHVITDEVTGPLLSTHRGVPSAEEVASGQVVAFSETGKGWWTGPNEQAGTLSARDYKSPQDLVTTTQEGPGEVTEAVTSKWAKGSGGPSGDEEQNLVAVAFSSKDDGRDATEELSPTLRAMGHDQSWENGGGQVAVAFSVYPESGQGSDLVARETDVAPALSAEGLAKANDRKTLVAYALQDVREIDKDQNGLGVGEDVAYTLDATGGQGVAYEDEDESHAVGFYPTAGRDFTAYDEVSPTIKVGSGVDIPSPPAVAYPLALRGREEGAELEMGEEGTYNALRAGDGGSSRQSLVAQSSVASFAENQRAEVLETDYARQLTAGGGKPGQGYPAVRDGLQVRRLLPIECSRLQGFPDDWQEGSDADATQADAREILHELWRTAGAEDREGRRSGIVVALLTPEVLLAGVHGGWVSWEMAHRCAAQRRTLPGADAWPEGFVQELWECAQCRPSPYRRESFEQLARQLDRPLSQLPLEGAQARAALLSSRLWEETSTQWSMHLAQRTDETSRSSGSVTDSARYKQMGNAVCVPKAEWIARRLVVIDATP